MVFIHGWNMTWDEYHSFSETMFKRLWHRGYKGRFCTFRWPTLTTALSYNPSEHRAWKYGAALKDYVDSLPRDYTKNLAAHSMGNVVAGSALHLGLSITNYALMQAAIPAGCFDSRAIVNSYPRFLDAESNDPTPDRADPDLGYRGHLTGVNGNLINFYNLNDFALATGSYVEIDTNWERNQEADKPSSFGGRYYDYDPARVFPERYQLWQRLERLNVLVRYVTKHEEVMSFIARPRSRALGSRAHVRGAIDGQVDIGVGSPSNFGDRRADHSAQFNRRIQQLQPFYQQLMQQLGIVPGQ